MTKPIIFNNARIINPATATYTNGALLVENGIITDISEGKAPGAPEGAEQVNAKNLLLAPGIVDTRVFTGEPGREYRETLESAANAAAAGGVTSFLMMPDTSPVIDNASLVDFIGRRAEANAKVHVLVAAAMSRGLKGEEITEYGLLQQAGAVCFTDGRKSLGSTALLKAAFTYAANYGMPVFNHVEDAGLAANGVMNAGLMATGLGLKGIPSVAETIALERDLQLAGLTGTKYHAAQISAAGSVDILTRHKADNKNISAGVSIANLALNENDIGSYRTFFKLSPPLRSEDDRQAMIAGLNSGAIDTIHSGHDPQDVETKRQPFAEAADGAIGMETLLGAALRLYHSGDSDLPTILRALSSRPAEILGLATGRMEKGAPADLMLIDVDYPWVVDADKLQSRSRNTNFEDARFTGKAMRTYVSGREVYRHTEDAS